MHPLWQNGVGSLAPIVGPVPTASGGAVRLWYDARDVPFLREDERDAAEIQQISASTIVSLSTGGFTRKSAIAAVTSEDLTQLVEDPNWISVQLQQAAGKPTPAAGGAGPKAPAPRAAERKFNPDEPRDPHGKWVGGGVSDVLKDVLKLGDKADLQPGEKLVGSDKLNAKSGSIRMALVDHGGHHTIRLGIGGEDFGHDEAAPWSAGPDRVTGIDAAGYTASLNQSAAGDLKASLADALDAATKAQENPSTQSGGTWGDYFSVEGSVPGQWADVHYAVYLDDPEVGVRVTLGAVPHGSGRDLADLDGYQQAATLNPAETKKFLRLLGQYEGA
jgi:hypothetical protein